MSDTAQATRQFPLINDTLLCEPIPRQIDHRQTKSTSILQAELRQHLLLICSCTKGMRIFGNVESAIRSKNIFPHEQLQKIWRFELLVKVNRILCRFTAEVDPDLPPPCMEDKLRCPMDAMFALNKMRRCHIVILRDLKHVLHIAPTVTIAAIPFDAVDPMMRTVLIPANNKLEKFFLGKRVLYRKSCRKDQHGFIASSL